MNLETWLDVAISYNFRSLRKFTPKKQKIKLLSAEDDSLKYRGAYGLKTYAPWRRKSCLRHQVVRRSSEGAVFDIETAMGADSIIFHPVILPATDNTHKASPEGKDF